MFCGKCGTKNEENTQFCVNCGAPLGAGDDTTSKVKQTIGSSSNDKNRKIGIIAVAVGALAVVVIFVSIFGGRSYKSVVNTFFKAYTKQDITHVIDLIPKKAFEESLEDSGYDKDEIDEFISEANEEIEESFDYIERQFGSGFKMTHKINETENITGDDLDEIKEYYEEYDVKVSAAKKVEVLVSFKGEDSSVSNTMDITVIKVGRSWYLDFESFTDML